MQEIGVQGITLFYKDEDKKVLKLVRQACEKSIRLMQNHYGIDAPEDCRVYIMNSWFSLLFHSATWLWKILLSLSIPLWYGRVKKTWPLAGGWAFKLGNRRIVGVKPPGLLESSNRDLGDRLFVRWNDLEKDIQSVTCHELTHAFTAHLRLPTWLNEGLAMNMVDKYFREQTVRSDTLERLDSFSVSTTFKSNRNPKVEDQEALLNIYARSYWLTRYIEETKPELLRTILTKRHSGSELEVRVAESYKMGAEEFWRDIDKILLTHFWKDKP
jgi:hypothetical protein